MQGVKCNKLKLLKIFVHPRTLFLRVFVFFTADCTAINQNRQWLCMSGFARFPNDNVTVGLFSKSFFVKVNYCTP